MKSFASYPLGGWFKDVSGSFVDVAPRHETITDSKETKRRCYFSPAPYMLSSSFQMIVSLAWLRIALNRRVPLVHMPVCAVYTKHRRMSVHRDPAALMMHAVGPARSRQ